MEQPVDPFHEPVLRCQLLDLRWLGTRRLYAAAAKIRRTGDRGGQEDGAQVLPLGHQGAGVFALGKVHLTRSLRRHPL